MSPNFPMTIQATYEGGALKLEQPLSLPDGTKLQVTIVPTQKTLDLDSTDQRIMCQILKEDREVFEALKR